MPKSLTTLVPLSLYQKSDVTISVEIDYITNVSKFALNGRNLSFEAQLGDIDVVHQSIILTNPS